MLPGRGGEGKVKFVRETLTYPKTCIILNNYSPKAK
jgi:hypothetical protein